MDYFLAIDVGGTFLKGARVDIAHEREFKVVRTELTPVREISDGGRVIDSQELLAAIQMFLRGMKPINGRCHGIGITGQMHGLVLVDRQLRAQTPIYTWRSDLSKGDHEVECSIPSLTRRLGPSTIRSTGNELRTGLPVQTLVALRGHLSFQQKIHVHSLISFVANSLVGVETTNKIHSTDAASLGMYDVIAGTWHHELLHELRLDKFQLPTPISEIECIGINEEFRCPVFVALGDHQTNMVGVELELDEFSVNLATGGQVSRITEGPNENLQLRPFFDDRFLHCVTHIPAGRSVNVLVSLFSNKLNDPTDFTWKSISEATRDCHSSTLRINNSFFESSYGSVGSISNINESNLNVGSIFRATCDAIVNMVEDAADKLDCGSLDRMVLSGGLLMRFEPLRNALIERMSQFRWRRVDADDASVRGLCTLMREVITRPLTSD